MMDNITLDNLTLVSNMSEETGNGTCVITSSGRPFDHTWYKLLLLLVSVVGILGNILNLIVLTRHRMLRNMDRLERSGTYGLIALAVSDMCFCLAQLPEGINPSDYMSSSLGDSYILYSKIYGVALRDTFMALSAWLIVIISVNRVIVVVYPMHARLILTGAKTAVGIAIVSAMCIVLTIPSYLFLVILHCTNDDGDQMVELAKGFDGGEVWLRWLNYRTQILPVLATFLPFAIMTTCNIVLVITLQLASRRRSRQFNVNSSTCTDNSNKIMITLMAVVIMFLVLVLPIEILLYRDIFSYYSWGHLVDKIFNILKALNFALNFMLYVMVNTKFRVVLRSLLPSRRQSSQLRTSCTRMSELTASRSSIVERASCMVGQRDGVRGSPSDRRLTSANTPLIKLDNSMLSVNPQKS